MKVKVVYPLLGKPDIVEIECAAMSVADGTLMLLAESGRLIEAFAPGHWFRVWGEQE